MPAVTGTCQVEQRDYMGEPALLFRWTCTAGGICQYNVEFPIVGVLSRLITRPMDTPTDSYDIVITTPDGIDVLQGKGADRDTANTEVVSLRFDSDPKTGFVVNDYVQFAVSNAGTSKNGLAILTFER